MNTQERIAKLESLLARITERAGAPRRAGIEPTDGPPPSVDVEVEVVALSVSSEPPIAIDVSSDTEVQSSERVVFTPEARSGEIEAELPPAGAPTDASATAELATEPEPAPAAEPAREPEPTPEPEYAPEPPASSRRPIALESKLEDMTFGDAAPEAPHTPPPESGRQIASPTDLDFDSDFTGVREKEHDHAEVAPIRSAPPPPALPLELPSGESEPGELSPVEAPPASAVASGVVASAPEVTLPTLPQAPVAIFEGRAPAFKPASFGELLEATLAL